MKTNLRIISGILFGGVLVTGFQNCTSKVDFSSSDGKVLQSLVATQEYPGDQPPQPGPQPQPAPQPNPDPSNPPVVDNPPPNNPPPVDNAPPTDGNPPPVVDNPPPVDNPPGDEHPPKGPKNPPPVSEESGGGDLVGCILLEGHGQSLKVGLLTQNLEGVESRVDSVCMPASSCLGEVANAFKVPTEVAPGSQGFCHGNPNVQHLTAAQVHSLLPVPAP
jgi:hypothetical protein